MRCVVQDCSNESDASTGISLHVTPTNKQTRASWVRFVQTKRTNFNLPDETCFMVCFEHFTAGCFQRAYHTKGDTRRLNSGALPTVWKAKSKLSVDEFSPRQHRKVSKYMHIDISTISTTHLLSRQVNVFLFPSPYC